MNFEAYNPVHLHFGSKSILQLGTVVKQYGVKALIVMGKSSAKKYGYFDVVADILEKNNINYEVYSGIKSNPTIDQVDEAIALGKKEKVDMVIALGGGSVLDSSKIIAIGIQQDTDTWSMIKGKEKVQGSLPLITILTLAATGSEMNAAAVVQNHETHEKVGFWHPVMYPKHSFLNPEYSYTVDAAYTAYGITDLMAHALEAYFGGGHAGLSDRLIAGILLEAMEFAPKVLADPMNYEYRANIMLAATMALNGSTNFGKKGGDWGVHSIGHVLSYLYDTPHGASLSITYPAWMRYHMPVLAHRIARLGELVFGTSDAAKTIEMLENFWTSINSPIRLEQAGIPANDENKILELLIRNHAGGQFYALDAKALEQILKYMYKS